MKKKRRNKPPTLNQKIAAANDPSEKSQLAITGGFRPKTEAEGIVFGWLGIRKLDQFGKHLADEKREAFKAWIERSTMSIIRSAMADWNWDLFLEIARVMKAHDELQTDPMTFWLLEAEKQGPVNVTKLAEHIEKTTGFRAELRTWQDRAQRLKIKTVSPGRPNAQQ